MNKLLFNKNVFEKFPVIETERLILRKIIHEDKDEVFAIYSSSEAMKYFGKNPFEKIGQAEEMIDKVINAFNYQEGIRWGITLKPSDKLIGTGGFWRILKDHLRAEIGYDLNPAYWKKGIMYEAITAMIKFAFNEMNLHSIEANIDPANNASEKLLEKTGFKKEGHITESFLFNGLFTDTGVYSLVNTYKT
ncbi:MAG: GNAT family N-acetyltransferase [Ignavibacteria bacterium]